MSSKKSKTKGKPQVIARLTIRRADTTRTIVEVHEDATFSKFFHIFTQRGSRRSTKKLVRVAHRSESQDLAAVAAGFEARQSPTNPITDTDIYVFRARQYRRMISASPDELGLTQCIRRPIGSRFYVAERS